MKAQDVAFGMAHLLAPEHFRKALKDAFDAPGQEPLDCWFDPRVMRIERKKDGTPVRCQGCWSIWQRNRTTHKLDLGLGFSVTVVRDSWIDVMRLDGSIPGLPVTPGAWTIRALQQADMTTRAAKTRLQDINRVHAEDKMEQWRQQREFVEGMSKDRILKNILAKQAEARGAETLSGDQRAAARRARAKEEKEDMERWETRAKDVQFYKR